MDIPALKAELEAARASIVKPLDGLDDLARLTIKPETASAVTALIVLYRRRERLLARALQALGDLERDGYPALPDLSVERLVYEDLRRNLKAMQSVLPLFEPDVVEDAVKVTITAGEPQTKTSGDEPTLFLNV